MPVWCVIERRFVMLSFWSQSLSMAAADLRSDFVVMDIGNDSVSVPRGYIELLRGHPVFNNNLPTQEPITKVQPQQKPITTIHLSSPTKDLVDQPFHYGYHER